MTPEEAANFYEEDEDPAEVFAAFERGVHGVTAPPDPANPGRCWCGCMHPAGFVHERGAQAAYPGKQDDED